MLPKNPTAPSNDKLFADTRYSLELFEDNPVFRFRKGESKGNQKEKKA